ncbi:MAG: 16S rRNA (cytosine(1402)-N(4))-methyltransferase RsmH [Verrucomicrobia bacterium]|nr:16S rRNA (cytosine(1402)-N(4))-methyltransferase RsmH [Verrucomicrobiota bacterium]
MPEPRHRPVLLHRTIELIGCRPGGTYVDATVGLGGHAEALAERIAPGGRLIGIDRDADALRQSRGRLARFGNAVALVQGNFDRLAAALDEQGIDVVDGVLFDLGVSSMQLDEARRGFSYQRSGRLDMRMDASRGPTARELVNQAPLKELERILRDYGEEPAWRRVARTIVRTREQREIVTTDELAGLIERAVPRAPQGRKVHPAARTFQALRIAVNDELGAIERALPQALERLRPGGRIVTLAYHSLEDRIVKEAFRRWAKGCTCPPEFPVCCCGKLASVRVLTKKPIGPDAAEVAANPRARSARLRACEKIQPVETGRGIDQ